MAIGKQVAMDDWLEIYLCLPCLYQFEVGVYHVHCLYGIFNPKISKQYFIQSLAIETCTKQ